MFFGSQGYCVLCSVLSSQYSISSQIRMCKCLHIDSWGFLVYFLGTAFTVRELMFLPYNVYAQMQYSILYIWHISTDYDYRLITIIIIDAYTSEIGNSLKERNLRN
jgi:hypothetical protein